MNMGGSRTYGTVLAYNFETTTETLRRVTSIASIARLELNNEPFLRRL
jgi:hypothetical protein